MNYRDSFGEVKKIRLSSEDYAELKKVPEQVADPGLKSLVEAMITEYDLKKAKYIKRCEDSGKEVLDNFGTGFEIYVPEYLNNSISKISELAPSLNDFVEQF
ncbi:MAG: hypothetical protein J6I68_14495 [Butyrivibrio sp.]|uniref:hypothetical protein n=1 Tax=Butyrivibrio sp. TaxID=28121 RepID=UPI001B6DE3DC|nr:hypothetical protein [Butyrivibrio sp.]MBP3784451.1 hypothetical protein [Butyrivibrio sp.]